MAPFKGPQLASCFASRTFQQNRIDIIRGLNELVTWILRQVRRHPHVLRRGPDQLAAELPRDVVNKCQSIAYKTSKLSTKASIIWQIGVIMGDIIERMGDNPHSIGFGFSM